MPFCLASDGDLHGPARDECILEGVACEGTGARVPALLSVIATAMYANV